MKTAWKDEYSVKIKKIDGQHKKLFEIISEIENLSKKPDFRRELEFILSDIKSYVKYHFEEEEKLMVASGYSRLEIHVDVHNQCRTDISKKFEEYINADITALDVMWLHNYLVDWVKNHIIEEDHKYMDALSKYHDL